MNKLDGLDISGRNGKTPSLATNTFLCEEGKPSKKSLTYGSLKSNKSQDKSSDKQSGIIAISPIPPIKTPTVDHLGKGGLSSTAPMNAPAINAPRMGRHSPMPSLKANLGGGFMMPTIEVRTVDHTDINSSIQSINIPTIDGPRIGRHSPMPPMDIPIINHPQIEENCSDSSANVPPINIPKIVRSSPMPSIDVPSFNSPGFEENFPIIRVEIPTINTPKARENSSMPVGEVRVVKAAEQVGNSWTDESKFNISNIGINSPMPMVDLPMINLSEKRKSSSKPPADLPTVNLPKVGRGSPMPPRHQTSDQEVDRPVDDKDIRATNGDSERKPVIAIEDVEEHTGSELSSFDVLYNKMLSLGDESISFNSQNQVSDETDINHSSDLRFPLEKTVKSTADQDTHHIESHKGVTSEGPLRQYIRSARHERMSLPILHKHSNDFAVPTADITAESKKDGYDRPLPTTNSKQNKRKKKSSYVKKHKSNEENQQKHQIISSKPQMESYADSLADGPIDELDDIMSQDSERKRGSLDSLPSLCFDQSDQEFFNTIIDDRYSKKVNIDKRNVKNKNDAEKIISVVNSESNSKSNNIFIKDNICVKNSDESLKTDTSDPNNANPPVLMARLSLPSLPNARCKSPRDIIEEAVVKRKGFCSSNIGLKKRKSGRLNIGVSPMNSPIPEEGRNTALRRKTGLQLAVPASPAFLDVLYAMIDYRPTYIV